MEKVRFGVVGIGNIGTAHTRCLYNGEVENAVLTAVCDISESRLEYCANKFEGAERFSDWKEMIDSKKIDAVIISVPHRLHALMAEYAIKAGVNVLCEKPVDISVSKAAALNEVAIKSGLTFGVMLNQRMHPIFSAARDIVKRGEIGEIKRSVWIATNWFRTQHYYDSGTWRATWKGEGGGVLLNQAPHNLDLWQWICGMPTSVTAFCDVAKHHNIEVEDDVTIFTRYENGAVGTFIIGTGEYPGTNRFEISGTLGKMVIENGLIRLWKLKESERKVCFESNKNSVDIPMDYSEITDNSNESLHAKMLGNFTNAILFGEELVAPGIEGINELMISNAAYLSSWKGNSEIKLPFETGEFDKILEEKAAHSNKGTALEQSVDNKGYADRWQVRW